MDDNRTVHAAGRGYEVVRYNRAGKWYVESCDGSRRLVTLDQAAKEAIYISGKSRSGLFLGRPGGRAFDHRVIAAIGKR